MYILHLALKMRQNYSMAHLLTNVALSTIYMFYTCFFCFFPVSLFSYTLFMHWDYLVSEFGFAVWNRTTTPDTMEYLPILLGKYPRIHFLELTRVFTVLRNYPGIYFAPKYKPFHLLAYSFYDVAGQRCRHRAHVSCQPVQHYAASSYQLCGGKWVSVY